MAKVAVIGSGMMGRGIAACCASRGSDVMLFDTKAEAVTAGVAATAELVAFLKDNGVGCGTGKIDGAEELEKAVAGVDFVFEAVFEDVGIKNTLFKQIEKVAPRGAILCTNTSSLSPTAIAEGLETADRFCAAHFIGPAHLVPLVELCPVAATKPESIKKVEEYLLSVGKKPCLMKKEIQGFIAARLQAALYREAMHIVLEGAADAEAVDSAVTNGFGRRLNQIGPFTVADFAGVDLLQKTHGVFFPQLGGYEKDQLTEELVGEGRFGVKSGHGHYKWDGDKAQAVAGRRDRELLRRLKEDA
eukprot:TRINITY_DN63_c0_g2_i1.p1 TRINITY_DN63_c0_g2~~TRINITY_DN63_c0_g2_i1.p1  ORF type:complete len:302 (+),score=128.16 TRINITY_DN63_c0_g2_i1:57-962(+)